MNERVVVVAMVMYCRSIDRVGLGGSDELPILCLEQT